MVYFAHTIEESKVEKIERTHKMERNRESGLDNSLLNFQIIYFFIFWSLLLGFLNVNGCQ